MAELGEMAGGVAHEINNPLAIMSAKLEIVKYALEDSNNATEEISTELQAIGNQIQRVSGIVKSLLGFARQGENDELRPIMVRTIVNETLELTRERCRNKNVNILVETNANADCAVIADHSKTMQVVLNILNNAIYALEDNCNIPKEIVINWTAVDENFVVTTIHDNGSGIKDEVKDKILQPFFTTKPIGEGTGLGLSLSKGLVEKMGGELYFESQPHNTTFFIKLRASQRANFGKTA